jgi:hypothetical protein
MATSSPKLVIEILAPPERNVVTSAGRYPSALVQVVAVSLYTPKP